jgi:hypothetical protein
VGAMMRQIYLLLILFSYQIECSYVFADDAPLEISSSQSSQSEFAVASTPSAFPTGAGAYGVPTTNSDEIASELSIGFSGRASRGTELSIGTVGADNSNGAALILTDLLSKSSSVIKLEGLRVNVIASYEVKGHYFALLKLTKSLNEEDKLLLWDSNNSISQEFPNSELPMALSGALDSSGNQLIVAMTNDYSNNSIAPKLYVFREDGKLVWNHRYSTRVSQAYGGKQQGAGLAYWPKENALVVLGGIVGGPPWALKVDIGSGQPLWETTLQNVTSGSLRGNFESMALKLDGVVLAGTIQSRSGGDTDGFAVKIEFNGRVSWIHSCGGTADDEFISVDSFEDGSTVLAGRTKSKSKTPSGEGFLTWIVGLSPDGEMKWEASPFGPGEMTGAFVVNGDIIAISKAWHFARMSIAQNPALTWYYYGPFSYLGYKPFADPGPFSESATTCFETNAGITSIHDLRKIPK